MILKRDTHLTARPGALRWLKPVCIATKRWFRAPLEVDIPPGLERDVGLHHPYRRQDPKDRSDVWRHLP